MKRLSILITLLVLSVIQMTAQDTSIKGTITLSHQGRVTYFAYNKMADVMDAAEDGDTVYLSTGYFKGDFILSKKLAFIGSGADTENGWESCTYYGESDKIIIKLPDNTKLTARLFEGIYFGNNTILNFQTAIEDVVFKKCSVYGYCPNIEADIRSILFDRCYIIGSGYYNSNIKKAIARNCKITNLDIWSTNGNEENSWLFTNCTIDPSNYNYENGYGYFCPIYRGTFVNCIIGNDDSSETYKISGFRLYNPEDTTHKSVASFTNCLFYKPIEGKDIFNGATVLNDMYFDTSGLENNWDILNFTKEKLLENNFLGNDGRVVGCYGGKNPYSLKMSQPTISSSKVHFDKDNKQIQIKMKVSSEQ